MNERRLTPSQRAAIVSALARALVRALENTRQLDGQGAPRPAIERAASNDEGRP